MYLNGRLKPPSSRKDRRNSDSGVSESSASSQSAGLRICREAIHESLKSDRLDAGDTGEGFSAEGVRMDRLETGGVASEAEPRTSSPHARRCSASISAILKNDKFGSAYTISRGGILSCSLSDTRRSSTQGRSGNRSFSLEISRRHNRGVLWDTLTTLLSYIYAIFVVVFGGVTTVLQPFQVVGGHIIVIDDIFAAVLCLLGLTWLGLLHADLCRHEKSAKRNRKSQQESGSDLSSVASDFASWTGDPTRPTFGYRYLTGRQSGSFYLKIGMTVFCCGHLIREGLLLGKEIIGWKQGGESCSDLTLMAVHVVRPVFSFYQLYFLFKYSNIVISKWVGLAKFGIMHCIATSLCFWFRTIVDDAYGDVMKGIREKAQASGDQTLPGYYTNSTCTSPDIPSPTYLAPMPYLYPFTIEFNLVLAGVWFIVLQNIRTSTRFPNLSQRRSSVDTTDKNLVISVDCHSANRGIFAGVVVLLASIVLMMIFYFTVLNGRYNSAAAVVYLTQEGALVSFAFAACIVAYSRTSILDVSTHPTTLLDDFLLCIPLPFYFIYGILVVIAELQDGGSYTRIAVQVSSVAQVVTQTPLIVDGLRRCSNCAALRYKKPGRETVSFLVVVNIAMWIMYTFESKTASKFFMGHRYYGLQTWVIVEHTTVPLMLFYRFHSSVCLADIWKSAYDVE